MSVTKQFYVNTGTGVTKFHVDDQESLINALNELHDSTSKINWVMLKYKPGSHNSVILGGKGDGGIDEFRATLAEDQVQYGILEVTVKGDGYNPVKYVLLTWIGPGLPPGLAKARAAGHRIDLREFIKHSACFVSCEHQAEDLKDVTYDEIAQAITRVRSTYNTSQTVDEKRQEMSRSDLKVKKQLAKFQVVDEAATLGALSSVFKGEKDWVAIAYVQGKKDVVELVGADTGSVTSLAKLYPKDRIIYAVLRLQVETQGMLGSLGHNIDKFVLITMIGDDVTPVQKARSAGQRQDIVDFIMQQCPFHGQFQPSNEHELVESEIRKVFQK